MLNLARQSALCVVVFLSSLALGSVAQRWIQRAGAAEAGDFPASSAAQGLPITLPWFAASGTTVAGPPETLHVDLRVNGIDRNASRRLALRSGSRFQIVVTSPHDGVGEVYAMDPRGGGTGEPLWRHGVLAGRPMAGPVLRLDSRTGLETLEVVLANATGGVVRRQVKVWHY